MSAERASQDHRILVVDDLPDIQHLFRRLLEPRRVPAALTSLESELFGPPDPPKAPVGVQPAVTFHVDCASQGAEALALVQAAVAAGATYAMAFVDMRMPPGWDGLRTIEELWRVDPDLEIVICSAYSDYTDQDIAARLGTTDQVLFLDKPFNATEVRQLARALTEKWALRRRARLVRAELEERLATRTGELEAIRADGRHPDDGR